MKGSSFLFDKSHKAVYTGIWNPGMFRAAVYPSFYCSQRPWRNRDKSTEIPVTGGLQTDS